MLFPMSAAEFVFADIIARRQPCFICYLEHDGSGCAEHSVQYDWAILETVCCSSVERHTTSYWYTSIVVAVVGLLCCCVFGDTNTPGAPPQGTRMTSLLPSAHFMHLFAAQRGRVFVSTVQTYNHHHGARSSVPATWGTEGKEQNLIGNTPL